MITANWTLIPPRAPTFRAAMAVDRRGKTRRATSVPSVGRRGASFDGGSSHKRHAPTGLGPKATAADRHPRVAAVELSADFGLGGGRRTTSDIEGSLRAPSIDPRHQIPECLAAAVGGKGGRDVIS